MSSPPPGERLVEEELPPGFWEEAQEPHPPSAGQRRQVKSNPDTQPVEEVSAAPSGGPSRAPGDQAGRSEKSTPVAIDDPAFATLQALFPGRVLSIETDEDEEEPAEETSAAAADAGSPDEPDPNDDD